MFDIIYNMVIVALQCCQYAWHDLLDGRRNADVYVSHSIQPYYIYAYNCVYYQSQNVDTTVKSLI